MSFCFHLCFSLFCPYLFPFPCLMTAHSTACPHVINCLNLHIKRVLWHLKVPANSCPFFSSFQCELSCSESSQRTITTSSHLPFSFPFCYFFFASHIRFTIMQWIPLHFIAFIVLVRIPHQTHICLSALHVHGSLWPICPAFPSHSQNPKPSNLFWTHHGNTLHNWLPQWGSSLFDYCLSWI